MIDRSNRQNRSAVPVSEGSSLEQAFVHPSYLNENPGFALPSNERLEFLGDAVLNLVVAEWLYEEFPELAEGALTEMRASLVRRETLAELASALKLGDRLLLGQGEEANGGRCKPSNLANALEALIGALYLEEGPEEARGFVLHHLREELTAMKAGKRAANYKALLQELVQARGRPAPVYNLVETTGPDHDRQFTVEILVEGDSLGTGQGKSKKAAESQAARAAWETLRSDHG